MRLRISNRAWHLRLVRSVSENPYFVPTNLCSYFWTVAGSLLARASVFLLVPFSLLLPVLMYDIYKSDYRSYVPFWKNSAVYVFPGLASLVLCALVGSFVLFATYQDANNITAQVVAREDKIKVLLMTCAIIYLIQGVAAGVCWFAKRNRRHKKHQVASENKILDTASLIWEFLKAKKNRVCPLIEVIDKK